MGHHVEVKMDEKYEFSAKLKTSLLGMIGLGAVFIALWFGLYAMGAVGHADGHGHGDEHAQLNADNTELLADITEDGEGGDHAEGEGHGHGEHSHASIGMQRLIVALWHNSYFFVGISIIGLFFYAIQYVSRSGWSASLLRVIYAPAYFLPIAAVALIITFFIGNHTLFHWTHSYLYEGTAADKILMGKSGFFFWPLEAGSFPAFYVIRMFLFLGIWTAFAFIIQKSSFAEDHDNSTKPYRRTVILSTIFIIFFAISSSIAAWDWGMSIDPHWFSTMWGWYTFASWFAGGLAMICLGTIILKEQGYLEMVNSNHLHDLGKYLFAFSIFWTYIWFSQFLLIYYSNIPEESVYFLERLKSPYYSKFLFLNLFLNFVFPFMGLMTRDAKRKLTLMKVVAVVTLFGHWSDFYLMVAPGVLKENGNFGFLEVGMGLVFLGAFGYVAFSQLAKHPLIPKNHPMIQESVHHSI